MNAIYFVDVLKQYWYSIQYIFCTVLWFLWNVSPHIYTVYSILCPNSYNNICSALMIEYWFNLVLPIYYLLFNVSPLYKLQQKYYSFNLSVYFLVFTKLTYTHTAHLTVCLNGNRWQSTTVQLLKLLWEVLCVRARAFCLCVWIHAWSLTSIYISGAAPTAAAASASCLSANHGLALPVTLWCGGAGALRTAIRHSGWPLTPGLRNNILKVFTANDGMSGKPRSLCHWPTVTPETYLLFYVPTRHFAVFELNATILATYRTRQYPIWCVLVCVCVVFSKGRNTLY